ncbi:MAG: Rieske 2Fe-2S domain-containing protein [Thermoplasmata archaeon]
MVWRSTGVAEVALKVDSPLEVHMDGDDVVLVRLTGGIHAFEVYCPHEGGVLAEGHVSGESIVCPLHGAEYNLRTGAIEADPDGIRPPTGNVRGLSTYPVKLVAGIVHVDLDAT